MKKKITISIEETTYEWAKERAEEQNRNLSNWIETVITKSQIAYQFINQNTEKLDEMIEKAGIEK